MPPNLCKPPPQYVLKTLSLGLEFENKLIELCGEAEKTLTLTQFEKNVKLKQSMISSTDEGNLVVLGHVNPNNIEGGPILIEGRDTSIKTLSIDEMLSSAIIETLDLKVLCYFMVADKEALSLLRWLATSQATKDINSNDELTHETALSPLLLAKTIDKVLEKANMDYESKSQKECQDILDSIDDLIEFEGLKERASHCSDQNHYSICSLESSFHK
ncbi:hypothetical protein CMV_013064 [Castanea mollissima]|uniref:Uncharacterized protein n=1 Tax=Castanea mollissima TaxID=60419 RepID=A0A8J4VIK6_9ROSI|nr:hypothetical protein CMV_013064 [Castanea mollissima]